MPMPAPVRPQIRLPDQERSRGRHIREPPWQRRRVGQLPPSLTMASRRRRVPVSRSSTLLPADDFVPTPLPLRQAVPRGPWLLLQRPPAPCHRSGTRQLYVRAARWRYRRARQRFRANHVSAARKLVNTDPAAAASHRWVVRNKATPTRQSMTKAALSGHMRPEAHPSEPRDRSRSRNWSHLFTNGASRVLGASRMPGRDRLVDSDTRSGSGVSRQSPPANPA
jgi:hypothetical protein